MQGFHVHSVIGDIAGRLKSLRENELQRMSLAKVGDALAAMGVENTSANSVSRYESGERSPPFDYLVGMARLAGVRLETLLFENGPPPSVKELRYDLILRVLRGVEDGLAERAAAGIEDLQG